MARSRTAGVDRKEEILRAAVVVISERGHADTRLSHVADRSGVSQALVVYYFKTRERLLAEALAYSDARFFDTATRELAGVPRATDKLVRLLELSCTAGDVHDPDQPSWVMWLDLWAVAARNPEVARHRRRLDRHWRDAIAAIIRQGEAAGEFRAVNVDDVTLRLAAMVDGFAVQVALEDPTVTPRRMLQLCLEAASTELGFPMPAVRALRRRRPQRPAPGRDGAREAVA